MIDLSYLKDWAWETEYSSEISRFIPTSMRSRFIGNQRHSSPMDTTSIPFPLGVRRGFPNLSAKPIAGRTIDAGFIGRTYPHRKTFLAELSNHPKLRRCRLNLTCELRLSISEYAEFLNDTKVSVCLAGNSSAETFRYFESTKSGCIVITPRMPDNSLCKDHAGIQVDAINEVDRVASVLESVLQSSAEQDALQQRSLGAWESQYSPQAIAAMIARSVESRRRAAAV